MNRTNCNIIKDLLPSYIDGICSDESVQLIEAHFLQCNECKNLAEQMQSIQLSAEKMPNPSFNFMRRIRKQERRQSIQGFALLVIAVLSAIIIIATSNAKIPIGMYYAILPLLSAGSIVFFRIYDNHSVSKKVYYIYGLISVAAGIYAISIAFLSGHWVLNDTYPFGLEASQLGPFVVWQMFLTIGIECIVFILAKITDIRHNTSNPVISVLCITGTCIALAEVSALHRLDNVEGYFSLRNTFITVLLIEGSIMFVLAWLWIWRGKRLV